MVFGIIWLCNLAHYYFKCKSFEIEAYTIEHLIQPLKYVIQIHLTIN